MKQVSSRVSPTGRPRREVELGPGDVLLADREGSVVGGQPARGRDRESHVVDRDPHRQVGMEPDPERCRLGGGVRRTRDDLEPVRREPILEAQLEPPWVRGLRVQDALQRDRFVGLRSRAARGANARARGSRSRARARRSRPSPGAAVERVSPAVETVRPGCQHLPASGRRRLVHREAVHDIEPARRVRPERRADLGHDDHLIAVADLVLFARGRVRLHGLLALARRRQ